MITLKTLPQATAQEVFDQVATHLLTQNVRAEKEDGGSCLYRAGNLKCAAGCLIADDEYKEEFDNLDDSAWPQIVAAGFAPADHMLLIRDLQKVHDNYKPRNWADELTLLAQRFDLDIAILNELENV